MKKYITMPSYRNPKGESGILWHPRLTGKGSRSSHLGDAAEMHILLRFPARGSPVHPRLSEEPGLCKPWNVERGVASRPLSGCRPDARAGPRAVTPSMPDAPSLRVSRYASFIHSRSMTWCSVDKAVPWITAAGHAALEDESKHRIRVERPRLIQRIEEAIAAPCGLVQNSVQQRSTGK